MQGVELSSLELCTRKRFCYLQLSTCSSFCGTGATPSVPGRHKILIYTGVHFGHYLLFHDISTLLLILNVGNLQLYNLNTPIIKTNFLINSTLTSKLYLWVLKNQK